MPKKREFAPAAFDDAVPTVNRDVIERPRVAPVPEADRIVIRSATSHEDNAENDETDNRGDFDGRKPELCLPVHPRTKGVDDEDRDE